MGEQARNYDAWMLCTLLIYCISAALERFILRFCLVRTNHTPSDVTGANQDPAIQRSGEGQQVPLSRIIELFTIISPFLQSLYDLKDKVKELDKKIEGFDKNFDNISKLIEVLPTRDVDVLLGIISHLRDFVEYKRVKYLLEIQKEASEIIKNIKSDPENDIEIPYVDYLKFSNFKTDLVHLVNRIYLAESATTKAK